MLCQDPGITTPSKAQYPNWKVKPIISWINYACPKVWTLGRALAVDKNDNGIPRASLRQKKYHIQERRWYVPVCCCLRWWVLLSSLHKEQPPPQRSIWRQDYLYCIAGLWRCSTLWKTTIIVLVWTICIILLRSTGLLIIILIRFSVMAPSGSQATEFLLACSKKKSTTIINSVRFEEQPRMQF